LKALLVLYAQERVLLRRDKKRKIEGAPGKLSLMFVILDTF